MEQYSVFELEFKGEEPKGSQVAVNLEATFTWKDEKGKETEITKKVKGFYAGNQTYKVRFMPDRKGVYN